MQAEIEKSQTPVEMDILVQWVTKSIPIRAGIAVDRDNRQQYQVVQQHLTIAPVNIIGNANDRIFGRQPICIVQKWVDSSDCQISITTAVKYAMYTGPGTTIITQS